MKTINNYINEACKCEDLTKDDWMLIGAIIDDLRGDNKHNLEYIRQKEDLKALYDKVTKVYQSCK